VAFGWDDAWVAPGPRGATARIWQVRVGDDRYALKEGRGPEPAAAAIAAELGFIERAASVGVRAPTLHADRLGRHVVPGPEASWLRLYDWLDTRPVDLSAPAAPVALGALLARLHRLAPPVTTESDGSPPDTWYDRPPEPAALRDAAREHGPFAARLAARTATLPALVAVCAPVDPARLVLCHRDLHPGNVVMDTTGGLVVLDQDDLGPADTAS
jgi:Ser/Thr protein kinase RdoA (MazF antagonist)